jgi:hypothetical protein
VNFSALKEFRKNASSDIKSVLDYLSIELAATIRELRVGMQNLSLKDNFDSFEVVLNIPANTEVEVVNKLTTVPTYYLILRKDLGGLSVSDGDQTWTQSRLYLKNQSATDEANIIVRFFK